MLALALVAMVFMSGFPSLAFSQAVYRCLEGANTIFTDAPVNDTCRVITVNAPQADPVERERLEERRRAAAELERRNKADSEREELRRAQIDAARATQRRAEAERRLSEQRLRELRDKPDRDYDSNPLLWPGYGYGYGYPQPPRHGTHYRPLPNPGSMPNRSVPRYPYGPDRIGVGGQTKNR